MDASVHRGLGCILAESRRFVKGGAAVHLPFAKRRLCAIVSERRPVLEEDLKLGVYLAPVLPLARPLPRDVHRSKVEHFDKSVVARENRLVLCRFLCW